MIVLYDIVTLLDANSDFQPLTYPVKQNASSTRAEVNSGF